MIEVTIDEVVLCGVPPEQAPAVVDAMRQRLIALATANTTALRSSETRSVRPRTPAVPATGPRGLGNQAADAVWSAVLGRHR